MPRGKPGPSTHGLRIGGVVIPLAALTDLRLTEAVNDDAKLAVPIAADARVDLRGAIVFDGPGGLYYEGWVTAAQPTDNGIEIQARSAPWLDEGRFPGWLVRTKVEEAAWSAGRLAGLRPDQINIPTLQLAREGFLVVAPVVDVVLKDSVIVGGVAFSSDQAGGTAMRSNAAAIWPVMPGSLRFVVRGTEPCPPASSLVPRLRHHTDEACAYLPQPSCCRGVVRGLV